MIGVGREAGLAASRSQGDGGRRAKAPAIRRSPSGRWTHLELAPLDGAVERPYWLALSLIPGMGPVSFARLLDRFGSAAAAWHAGDALLEELAREPDEARPALDRLRRFGVAAVAERLEQRTAAAHGVVVTALDDRYPRALALLDPRPPVLYVRGAFDAFEAPCIAVVGTRRPSGYGMVSALEIADELARGGVTVVSGLALGIDGQAHRAALAAGGLSIAVLPSPIDRIYPPRHRALAGQLVAGGGALVSEVPPGQAVGRPDFARRNRIIAGLAAGVVVVEAPDRSGALLTAQAALDYGKELYAVPGPIDAAASRGCNRLIADHAAALVTSPVALLHQLGVRRRGVPVAVSNLSDSEALVLARLLERSGSVEELIGRTALSTGQLTSSLTLLETRGLAASYGGVTFHPTLAARRLGRPG